MNEHTPQAETHDPVVPLAVFAETLRPRKIGTRTAAPRAGVRAGVTPHIIDLYSSGSPDEIWLKLLQINHGNERHTVSEWHGIIDSYRDEPAHPSVLT